jgi:TonB family protein
MESWSSMGIAARVLVIGLALSAGYLLTVLIMTGWLKRRAASVAEVAPGAMPDDQAVLATPPYRLYSEPQIVASTIFFTPVVGAILLRSNLRKLGEYKKSWWAFFLGPAVLVGLFAIGILLRLIGVTGHVASLEALSAAPMHYAFKRWMAEPMRAHLAAGGKIASVLGALAASLLYLGVAVSLVLAVVATAAWRGVTETEPAPAPAPSAASTAELIPPKFISGPAVEYTAEALRQKVKGRMAVQCTVTVEGRVHRCRAVSSIPLMDGAVIQALEQRRYTPAHRDGKPVEVVYTFKLELTPPE